jgi:hypothetical protein
MNRIKPSQNLILIFSIIATIFIVNFLVFAWTEPASSPPNNNVSAPLNIGNTGQSKAGGLILNVGGASNGLIIANGNVGIGMSNPSKKLDVAGDINSNGNVQALNDVCISSGACLSQLNDFIKNQPLVNNVHNYGACTKSGGEVIPSDVSYPMCRFGSVSCPAGWSQYKGYNAYNAGTGGCSCGTYMQPGDRCGDLRCNGPSGCLYGTHSCSCGVPAVTWGNNGNTATCSCQPVYQRCALCTCTATVSMGGGIGQIGCY